MSYRKAIVVATHPEDHSVDLVMVDNGARVSGVQVMAPSASSRTGTVDLPAIPPKKNKWDITEQTDQEVHALVAYVRDTPVVAGFLYPQINQVLSKDPKRRISRHQSDVSWFIDGDGNIQLDHPGGAYIRIGEAADREDTTNKNADASAQADRNTGRKVNVRVGLAGNVVVLTMTPEGAVTFALEQDFTIEAKGNVSVHAEGNDTVKADQAATVEAGTTATIKAPSAKIDALATQVTGALTVDGLLTYKAGLVGSGGAGAAVTGNMTLNGNLQVSQNIAAGGTIVDSDGDGGA